MSAADPRIGDGVFIPIGAVDRLQPQSSALLLEGRPGRRDPVKVDVFGLTVSVLTADGATRHLVEVSSRLSLDTRKVPPRLFPLPPTGAAKPRCVRNCARRWEPTKKKGCVQDIRETGKELWLCKG